MTREDVIRFATRDWAAVAAAKASYWAERKHHMSPAEALSVGDELRRFTRTARPDWPSDEERAADLEVHQRMSEALRAVVGAD